MTTKTIFLTADGLGRPATRGRKVGDELQFEEGKAKLYLDRGWASASKPSAEVIDSASALAAPPARLARKPAKAKRHAKAPAKPKAAAAASEG